MEVVVTEEKKKIFRARKTMKISDRQQLETLHSTLFTAASSSSEPSPPPPLMNGSHREDGQKDMEQNSHQDSNSPIATSPASMTSLSSPAPFLSLNLSPSPVPSQSPKEKDEPFSGPSSPFQTIDFEQKKEEGNSLSLQETSEAAAAESKEPQDSTKVLEKPEEAQTPAEKTANEAIKDSAKGSASLPPESDGTVPMETNATMADDAARIKSPSTNSSIPSASSSVDIKQDKDIKQETSKDQQKRNMLKQDKMEVTVVKVEAKKIKTESEQSLKPPRPSSTPPSGTASEKNCSSGIKRTLSEGFDKEGQTIKRDGKRPKMDQGELEAQLELKITAKAGSHHKLEKIVQQLVSERLKALEMAILEESFQDLKGRVDKIECATKHQMAIHSLQAKIARLSKKFGEANQASENKRKHEALVASSAIAAAAAAVASAAATTTTKTSVINTPQVQRVLRRQAVEPQPETPRQQVALSDGKTPGKKEKGKEDKGQAKEKEMPRKTTMAKDLAEYNEGKCKADIKLRPLPAHMEKVLYHNSKRNTDAHRPDRYASYIFRYLVPYEIYCNWVNKVDYVGLMGKQALPRNLRRTMRKYIEHRFPGLPNGCWREIRDLINEILQVKRRPEFFQKVDGKNGFLL